MYRSEFHHWLVRKGSVVLVSIAASALLGTVACTNGGAGDPPTSAQHGREATTTTPDVMVANTAVIDFGEQVRITPGGVVPNRLVTVVGREVTFVNETDVEVVVSMTNGPSNSQGIERSTPIAPGATYRFAADRVRRVAFVVEGLALSGMIQVDPGW